MAKRIVDCGVCPELGHMAEHLAGKLLPNGLAVALRQAHLSQNQYSQGPACGRNYIVAALADGTHWDLFADHPLDWHNLGIVPSTTSGTSSCSSCNTPLCDPRARQLVHL